LIVFKCRDLVKVKMRGDQLSIMVVSTMDQYSSGETV